MKRKTKKGDSKKKKDKKAPCLPTLQPEAAATASKERKLLHSRVYHQQRDLAEKSGKTLDEGRAIAKAAAQKAVAERLNGD